MRKNGIIIAIDGPAGVGKSSVGKSLALRINYKFLSTGKMYRALAWKALKNKLNIEDENLMLDLANNSNWEFVYKVPPEPIIYLDGIPLDKELTDEEIGKATSSIARLLKVRNFMVLKQREIGKDGGFVMEGRDIGTNVFPDAELKIYLDASSQARALRRVKQLKYSGIEANYNEILEMIEKRDYQDSLRKYNPLKKASDSIYLDSTNMSQDDVCQKIYELYKEVVKS